MPTILHQTDLSYASSLLHSGQPTAINDLYNYFQANGYNYAVLAKAVVNQAPSGVAGVEFMKNAAEAQGKPLSQADIDSIEMDMAAAYLGKLQEQLNSNVNDEVTHEVLAKEANAFHTQVFNSHGLNADTWVLDTPFKLLDDYKTTFGVDIEQQYWDALLNAQGNYLKETQLNSSLALYIAIKASEGNSAARSWVLRASDQDVAAAYLGDFLARTLPYLQVGNIDEEISKKYTTATLIPGPRKDPLVLDLDGDGLENLGVNALTPLMFDIDNSGVKTSVGWIKPDDGFLVLDRNANGTIDSGAELFGDATPLNAGEIGRAHV